MGYPNLTSFHSSKPCDPSIYILGYKARAILETKLRSSKSTARIGTFKENSCDGQLWLPWCLSNAEYSAVGKHLNTHWVVHYSAPLAMPQLPATKLHIQK